VPRSGPVSARCHSGVRIAAGPAVASGTCPIGTGEGRHVGGGERRDQCVGNRPRRKRWPARSGCPSGAAALSSSLISDWTGGAAPSGTVPVSY